MPRQQSSSIDRLPQETRELIGLLRTAYGRTIDEIMDKLRELEPEKLGEDGLPSRSAIGRHVKRLAEVGDTMRRSRVMADALVKNFGEEPDDRLARVNMELLHDITFRMLTAAEPDEETGEMGEVTMSGLEAGRWAGVVDRLTRAADTNSKRHVRELEDARTKAAQEERARQLKALEDGGKRGDIDREAVERAKRILGFG